MSEELAYTAKGKEAINYEATFNIHVQRTNFLISQINMKEGITIYALLPFYTAILTLHGLISANGVRTPKDYQLEFPKKLLELKDKLNLQKVASMKNSEESQVDAWFFLCDIWAYQLQQMYPIGLVPAEDDDDIIPNVREIVEKSPIMVPKWKPTVADFDYKKELGLPEKVITNDNTEHSTTA